MKNQKDQYNFSRPSTSSEAGFEVFREEKNKLYYFHVNDDNGKILLYSQGYKTKRGRDNGIRSIIQNRRDRSRYSITQEAEYKYYFVLKARNSQEIARSNYFVSEKQIEEKIQYLMESSFSYSFVQKQKRKARSLASKKSNKMTTSANYSLLKKTPKPKTALNKHAFRIDIYNKEDGMVGKIEHLLSKEKVSFTHLDFAAIQDFMEQFILPGKKEKELKKSSISALSFIPEKVEKPAITKLESDAGLSLSLSQTEAATKEEVEQIFEESTQPLSTQVLVEKLAPPKKASSQNAFEYLFINTAE
ncbi:MAG TPA: DUF1508 domain-containing protein, partial [Saprospiraceae bacterium]|nr:DUF1508 domain-containing protein [Saprospiraceae bacterium]